MIFSLGTAPLQWQLFVKCAPKFGALWPRWFGNGPSGRPSGLAPGFYLRTMWIVLKGAMTQLGKHMFFCVCEMRKCADIDRLKAAKYAGTSNGTEINTFKVDYP